MKNSLLDKILFGSVWFLYFFLGVVALISECNPDEISCKDGLTPTVATVNGSTKIFCVRK